MLRGLEEFGYIEGKNIIIEYRGAEAKEERIPRLIFVLPRSRGPTQAAPLWTYAKQPMGVCCGAAQEQHEPGSTYVVMNTRMTKAKLTKALG